MKTNKNVTAETVTPKTQQGHYNRLENYLLENFDATIEEVKDFEKLVMLSPFVFVLFLDTFFHFIGR